MPHIPNARTTLATRATIAPSTEPSGTAAETAPSKHSGLDSAEEPLDYLQRVIRQTDMDEDAT